MIDKSIRRPRGAEILRFARNDEADAWLDDNVIAGPVIVTLSGAKGLSAAGGVPRSALGGGGAKRALRRCVV